MKLSIGQLRSGDDVAANSDAIARMADQAAADGAAVLVLPEFAMYDLPAPDHRFVEVAEPLDGPFVRGLSALAARLGIAIVAGMLESVVGEDRARNTIVAIAADGSLAAVYRKVHLYNAFGARESDLIRPSDADGPVTFDVEGVRFGLHTCYDLRFPESSRELVDAGAEVLLLPASWVPGPRKELHWRVLAQARAIENTVFFAAVGQAPPVGVGDSMVIDPMGVIVLEIGEDAVAKTVEIDLERIQAVRAKNPSLTDRRFHVARRIAEGA